MSSSCQSLATHPICRSGRAVSWDDCPFQKFHLDSSHRQRKIALPGTAPRTLVTGSRLHLFLCCDVLALWCDFGVGADIGGVPSFINIEHVFISERKLLTSMCCYLVQNIKHQKENNTREPTKKRRKSRHTSEKNPMCKNNSQTPAEH